MYAQRDIHMVERLLDGNAALCTMHGKHFCDCYQIRDRCSWEWNVDSWISIPNLSLHVLYVLRVLLCLSPPPPLSLSLSLSLFLSLFSFFLFASFRSLFFARSRIKVSKRWTCRVRFSEFSIHRVTEPLKTVVYRFVDRETFDHAWRSLRGSEK